MLTEKMMDQLERHIHGWTRAINGQFPRPWMTDSPEPHKAEVFIVGRNQKHGYEVSKVGSQERHINALFNRNGETCRGIYDEIAPMPSRTRMNTDALTRRLRSRGIEHILETNVICYSSPMSGDLSKSEHVGGKAHGMEVFRGLLDLIRPKVLIAHGSGTLKDLARILGESHFELPDSPAEVVFRDVGPTRVYSSDSLAPPRWYKWHLWADEYLENLAGEVKRHLKIANVT